MSSDTPRLTLRVIEKSDYPELAELMDLVFHDVGGAWPRMTIMDLIHQFPDGQICIEDNGKIVGAALTIKVDYNRFSLPMSTPTSSTKITSFSIKPTVMPCMGSMYSSIRIIAVCVWVAVCTPPAKTYAVALT